MRLSSLVAASLLCTGAFAAEDNGYSYFSFGAERTSYSETFYSGALKGEIETDSAIVSPVYISGGLVTVNDRYDFSYDH